jgi:hypothetical protein
MLLHVSRRPQVRRTRSNRHLLEHRKLLKKVLLVSTALSTSLDWYSCRCWTSDWGCCCYCGYLVSSFCCRCCCFELSVSLASSGWGAVAAQFAVRAVLGYALNALSSKPKPTVDNYKANVNQLGVALPQQVIYGQTRVGGAVFYQALSNSPTQLSTGLLLSLDTRLTPSKNSISTIRL